MCFHFALIYNSIFECHFIMIMNVNAGLIYFISNGNIRAGIAKLMIYDLFHTIIIFIIITRRLRKSQLTAETNYEIAS